MQLFKWASREKPSKRLMKFRIDYTLPEEEILRILQEFLAVDTVEEIREKLSSPEKIKCQLKAAIFRSGVYPDSRYDGDENPYGISVDEQFETIQEILSRTQ